MNSIYKIDENIVEEIKRIDGNGVIIEEGVYRVISIENIYNNIGNLDRIVAITELHTGKANFWYMILDMMKKHGYPLKRSSEALQNDIKERLGENQ